MGVCGCGKSTVGTMLADQTGGRYLDGDDFHPPENKAKMGKGIPLDDADREGWLAAIRDAIDAHPGPWPLSIGCSALKRKYREVLRGGSRGASVQFIHLTGARELLEQRMQAREGHYMKAGMLDSQLAALEQLETDEPGFAIDVRPSPQAIVTEILARL